MSVHSSAIISPVREEAARLLKTTPGGIYALHATPAVCSVLAFCFGGLLQELAEGGGMSFRFQQLSASQATDPFPKLFSRVFGERSGER